MRIIQTIDELRHVLSGHHGITLIPTMGNLHEGHMRLVEIARHRNGMVVASIFVNELQFAPHEDFATYPRTLERDCELLASAGCDMVFAPSSREMYPQAQECMVNPPAALVDILEGQFRPGFFIGVATVVLKLFNIVRPSVAIFGKKDYQQLLVIRSMVRQFALKMEIIAAETVRDGTGLALSSRNAYLQDHERHEASQLYSTLRRAADEVRTGRSDWQQIERVAVESLNERGWQADYVSIRQREDLSTPAAARPLVIVGAARLGNARLIDSLEI